MVGKRRLKSRLGRPSLRVISRGDDSGPREVDPGGEEGDTEAGRGASFDFENFRKEKSMGRRSDRQSRKAPPSRNAESASQTPAAGERRLWRARETPIKERE